MSKYDELYNRIRKEIISEQWLPGADITLHIKKQKKQTKPSIQAKAISYTI